MRTAGRMCRVRFNVKSVPVFIRVFYDRTLAESFIAKGRGTGVGVLFNLALVYAAVLALAVYWLVKPLSVEIFQPVLEENETFTIENGHITAPEGYQYAYISPDKSFFFIFDTRGEPLSLKELPSAGFILTKDGFVSVFHRSVSFFPLRKLASPYRSVVLKSKDLAEKLPFLIASLQKTTPPLFFIISAGGYVLLFLFYTLLFSLVSFLMTLSFQVSMPYKVRLRLTSLSFLPFAVLNGVAQLAGIFLSFGVASIVTLVYMFCFVTEYSRATAGTSTADG